MKSGQRDLLDSSHKRYLSISSEELETLYELIKDSVLEELRKELRANLNTHSLDLHSLDLKPLNKGSLQQKPSYKKPIIQRTSYEDFSHSLPTYDKSEAQRAFYEKSRNQEASYKEPTNQRASKNPSLDQSPSLNQQALKASILSEIRKEFMENAASSSSELLKNSVLKELHKEFGNLKPSETEQKLKEMKNLHDGLLRELLDQKTVVKKLEERINQLSEKLEKLEKLEELEQLGKKSYPFKPPLLKDPLPIHTQKRIKSVEAKKRPEPTQEGFSIKDVSQTQPERSARVKLKIEDEAPETQALENPETKCEYIIAESGELKANQVPKKNPKNSKPRKCEFIVAEQPVRPVRENESIIQRDDEDVEIITCERKMLNTH